MLCQQTLRSCGIWCRGNETVITGSLRSLSSAITPGSSSFARVVSTTFPVIVKRPSFFPRAFHASPANSSESGIKEFIPKWLRRDEEYVAPEELIAPEDFQSTRNPTKDLKRDYHPPDDVSEQIDVICRRLFSADDISSAPSISSLQFPDVSVKFFVLDACVETFGKRIPSSFLDELTTIGDVIEFFSQPLLARDQILERMRDSETTPANVHVIPDYMTFEEEMRLYEGRDVYPDQDIIVSSLREKGKYKSVRKPKCPWEEAQGFELPVRYKRHKGF